MSFSLKKGPWTKDEDAKVIELVQKYGPKRWSLIAKHLRGRLGKQCRERWHNHLNPDIKKTAWSENEDAILLDLHSKMGNKWAEMAKFLPGRSDNAIKNHWNSTIKKRIEESSQAITTTTNTTSTTSPKKSAKKQKIVNNSKSLKLPVFASSVPYSPLLASTNSKSNESPPPQPPTTIEDDVLPTILLEDPNFLFKCAYDQHLFENYSLNSSPVKQQANNESTHGNYQMMLKIRTPTPLKNAMNKIKLQEEQAERLRFKSLQLNSQFSDSGYLSSFVDSSSCGASEEAGNAFSPSKFINVKQEYHNYGDEYGKMLIQRNRTSTLKEVVFQRIITI